MKIKAKDIIILIESGSDFPLDLAKENNIEIVPMHVIIDQHDYCDGQLPISKIIEYYDNTHRIPSTSAANVSDYLNAYRKIHKQYPDKCILHLCYSAVTTATWQNSIIASEDLDYVYHIDTKFVSGGQTLVVYKIMNYKRESSLIIR